MVAKLQTTKKEKRERKEKAMDARLADECLYYRKQ
jgi:hypothetical protein